MATDNVAGIDYSAVLADLKAKRADLDAAIASIERMLGQSSPNGMPTGAETEVQPDSFFGMSIVEGTKKYLAMKKRPQTTPEIADALDKGGMTHTSGNWGNTVGSVINRSPEFVKIKRGTWGLASWYPNRRREKAREDEPVDNDGADSGQAGE